MVAKTSFSVEPTGPKIVVKDPHSNTLALFGVDTLAGVPLYDFVNNLPNLLMLSC